MSMRSISSWVLVLGLAIGAAACGDSGGDRGDGGVSDGASCTSDSDCNRSNPRGVCEFALADGCNAKGRCYEPPANTVECASFSNACGCDGTAARTGCQWQDGYASAPVIPGETNALQDCPTQDGGF
ncbi:MAG TPA: hypothetical protein VIA18_22555 [Polyangia bacterium]|jgi:hypothetical protein|nr:hypothetical protein [Polyangia bacterium]